MQVSKNSIAIKVPSGNRSIVVKSSNRKGKNGSGKAGTHESASFGPRLYFLESTLRSKSLFELSIRSSSSEPGVDQLLKIVDTEEKQLQAIVDLYAIVKAQPKYRKSKEPNWKESDTPIEILHWLLRKLGPLAKGNQWTIDTYQDGRNKRFRFVVFKKYSGNKIVDREEHLPLDFLPFLKKRDQQMHDMIIDVVALVSKNNKIPLWDEDGDFSIQIEDLKKESTSWNYQLDAQRLSYSTGPAAEYLRLIHERQKSVKAFDVTKQMVAYDASSQRKESIMWWLRSGIQLASNKQDISINTYVPDYVNGSPITPFRTYKFVWSVHQHDVVKVRAHKQMKKDLKAGNYMPLMFSITLPGQKVKDLKYDPFPEYLYDFLSTGFKMVCYRYREYFYKNMLDEEKTPVETMLEQIEKAEIRTL